MSALGELERRLVDGIVGRAAALDGVTDPVQAAAGTGFRIYVEAYRLRLLEALGHDYPKLLARVGADEFARIGRAYIAAHPSRQANLRWFGRALGDFLGHASPWRDDPALADVAHLEWAENEAFDAADAPVIGPEALAALAPEAWPGLVLSFHPSLRRVDAKAETAAWLFWRQGLDVMTRRLDLDEAAALDAARQGAPFEAVCRVLASQVGQDAAPARAAGLLRVWLEAGLVVGV